MQRILSCASSLRSITSGAGSVDYLGDPTVTQDISGMGRVKRLDSAQAFIHERA